MRGIMFRRCVRLVVLCAACACVASAREVRVALLPPQRGAAAGLQGPALLQFLNEWAQGHAAIRPADPERCELIVGWLKSGAFSLAADDFFNVFVAIQPVDAWIDLTAEADGARLRVQTADAAEFLLLSSGQMAAFRQAARASCAFIEQTLKVTPDHAATAMLDTFVSDAEAVAYCTAPLTYARWPNNSGEAQLESVLPFWSVERTGPALASRILASALMQVSSKRRNQDYTSRAVSLAQAALPRVLGTDREASAEALVVALPESFENTLVALAQKVAEDELLTMPDLMGGDSLPKMAAVAVPTGDPLGAVRLLGKLTSKASLESLTLLAKAATPAVRVAVAQALLDRTEPEALAQLEALQADADRRVTFLVRLGAWRREASAGAPIAQARALLPEAGGLLWAVAEVLTTAGGVDDLEALRFLAASHDPAVRRPAIAALRRLLPDDVALWEAALCDPDVTVMRQALFALPETVPPALRPRLMALCDDPQAALGEAARAAVQTLRPTDRWEALRFDLSTEHPWVRRRLVARLAAETVPQAREVLREVCANRNAGTRADALAALMVSDVATGRAAALIALADPHRRVRLQAAALLADHAATADGVALHDAAATESDAAVRAYLSAADARLAGTPAPSAPSARSVAARPALTWMCGMGNDAATSPYGAYYNLGVAVNERWREAYAAGKICFGRVSTVAQPGLAVLDPTWEDRSWLAVEAALPLHNLDVIDGVVFGEETMDFAPDSLWESGWRLFCIEAGLDPAAIAGAIGALNATQRRAWRHWAAERHIDGFNRLYDDTKLRFGLLRPGLQVATFLTEQCLLGSGPNPADLRWKFDVGGIYDYKGSSRVAYYLIRRIKTLWPERPIIWLSLGIGGYEMNPVKYSLVTPATPLHSRADRAYADSMSAWLAGADVGWFSTWIFVLHDFKGGMGNLSGVQILLEDIAPGSPEVARGVEFAFKDIEKVYTPKPVAPGLPTGIEAPSAVADAVMAALDAESDQKAAQAIRDRIVAEKTRMKDGFLFYRYYIDSAARIFGDLPRRYWRSPFLAVRNGLSVWSRAAEWADTTGLNLLSECDFLADFNKVPAIGIDRYRTIVVANTTTFTDATLEAVTAWLRDTPNLLIVSGWLPTGNEAGVATVSNLTGRLTADWPWEGDISATPVAKPTVTKKLALTGDPPLTLEQGTVVMHYAGSGIEPLWLQNDAAVVALWRKKGFAGAVLFDGLQHGSADYHNALRARINALADQGIGLPLPETAFVQLGNEGAVHAGAASPSAAARAAPLTGADWLSGVEAPAIGPGRRAAVTAETFEGDHVVCHDGIVVVATAPLTVVARDDGRLTVSSSGLMQVAGGALELTAAGAPLPERAPDAAWLFQATTDGAALQTWQENGRAQSRWFVRSASPVKITRQP